MTIGGWVGGAQGDGPATARFTAVALWAGALERVEPLRASGLGPWLPLAEPPTLHPQSGPASSCPGTYARPSRGGSGSP